MTACMRWSPGRIQTWRRPEDGGFDIAVRRAMNDRKRALADAASLRSGAPRGALEAADSRFRADVKAAADEYAAALIEAHARSPRSQQDPRQQNGGAS